MTKSDAISLTALLAFIWVMGYAAGWSNGITPQIDALAQKTDHSMETAHHAHQ